MSPPGVIHIRPAGIDDAPVIARFNAALAEESEGLRLDPPVLSAGVRAALTDANRATYFVAEIDARVVGQTMVTTEWSDWRNAFFWWIQSVYVDPAFRRRGVFRALHNFIRDQARSRPDVCGLRLYVHRANAAALRTYACLGLTQTEYHLLEECWRR